MSKQEDIYDPNYRHDASNLIHETAIVHDNVRLGKNNVIGPYTVIGSNGEIRGVKDFKGQVIIGDNNIISEHVTIQRPAEDAKTSIGNNNLIMAHAHVGHDVTIENDCEICSGVILGGYVTVKNKAKIKLGAIIRNRKKIGEEALVGLGACVVKDVEAKTVVIGNPAKVFVKQSINIDHKDGN